MFDTDEICQLKFAVNQVTTKVTFIDDTGVTREYFIGPQHRVYLKDYLLDLVDKLNELVPMFDGHGWKLPNAEENQEIIYKSCSRLAGIIRRDINFMTYNQLNEVCQRIDGEYPTQIKPIFNHFKICKTPIYISNDSQIAIEIEGDIMRIDLDLD